ncbi:MAG TPA: carboxypeptidase-like regulatory domain-containing protein [Terriglobia bacterium]|nr:carboxypeptidase-like regulatory domain-containing protein [Terriglobia bacterium]
MGSILIALVALAAQVAPRPQGPAASIEGIVVKMGSGEPLAGAKVTLDAAQVSPGEGAVPCPSAPVQAYPNRCAPSTATTGRDGKFILDNVLPGSYRLIATRTGGYVPAEYGQRSPTGEGISLEIVAGQKMTGIQLAMAPTGSIAGRVYDRDGEPLGRAQVQALRSVYRNGRRTMTIVQSVETNDRGEYRLFWLAPGPYYISARPDIPEQPSGLPAGMTGVSAVHITEPARFGTREQASMPVIRKRTLRSGEVEEETYVAVYHPGTLETGAASAIFVGAGAAVSGIDIPVGAGVVPVRHISGRAIDGENGQPLIGEIMAIPLAREAHLIVPRVRSDANGLFDISGAVQGSYLVTASNGRLSGMVPVEVGNRDLQNIAVVATSGFKLSGRFTIEGRSRSGNDPKISDLRVNRLIRDREFLGMPPAGPSFSPPPSEDGSFTLEGIGLGDFQVTVRGVPQDGYVKSMRLGNADVLDDGLHVTGAPENLLEIVVAANAGTINGSVVNTRQEPVVNRTVVLVPDLRHRHRTDLYKTVHTDSSGRFRMQGVPPGDYKLFAWENVETGAWQDSDFMLSYEDRGSPIHITEDSAGNIQLTVIP